MTTTPSMWTECSRLRIASTAAWSAASLSPRPTSCADARAANSVTRTSSSARLRSSRVFGLVAMRLHHSRWLARPLHRRGAQRRPAQHEDRPEERDEDAEAQRDEARDGARLVDERVVADEADRGDRHDRGHLAARPRQGVAAEDDPAEDQRCSGRGEQQPAHDRVDVPPAQVRGAALARDVHERVLQVVPGQEQPDGEEDAADHGDDLRASQLSPLHVGADPIYRPPATTTGTDALT